MSRYTKGMSVTLEGSSLKELLKSLQEIDNLVLYEPWLQAYPDIQDSLLIPTEEIFFLISNKLKNCEGPRRFDKFSDALYFFTKGEFEDEIAYQAALRFLQRWGPWDVKIFIEGAYNSLLSDSESEDSLIDKFKNITDGLPIGRISSPKPKKLK